jgi:hypothetical protein
MLTARKLALCLAIASISAFAADSCIAGVWTANLHDLPAIKMTVKDVDGKLSGNIIFYFLMKENGVWHNKGGEPTKIIHPRMEGDTFVFEVPHAKRHGSTDPADQEIKTFRFHLTGSDEGVFRDAVGKGQDIKLRRQNNN